MIRSPPKKKSPQIPPQIPVKLIPILAGQAHYLKVQMIAPILRIGQ